MGFSMSMMALQPLVCLSAWNSGMLAVANCVYTEAFEEIRAGSLEI